MRFADVARALERVRTPDCVLDGEVCALDEDGRSSFSVMQLGSGPLVFYAFDVLEVDGSPCSISRSSSGVSACARSSIFGDDRPALRELR